MNTQITKIDDVTAEITITPPAPAPIVKTVTIDDLQAEIDGNTATIAQKQGQIDEITGKYNAAIKSETAGLQADIDVLNATNTDLTDQISQLQSAGIQSAKALAAQQVQADPTQQLDITPLIVK